MRLFYPDLEMIGKHYLVQEQDNDGHLVGSARQYTVSNTMQPDLYSTLTNALQNPTKQMTEVHDVVNQINKNKANNS